MAARQPSRSGRQTASNRSICSAPPQGLSPPVSPPAHTSSPGHWEWVVEGGWAAGSPRLLQGQPTNPRQTQTSCRAAGEVQGVSKRTGGDRLAYESGATRPAVPPPAARRHRLPPASIAPAPVAQPNHTVFLGGGWCSCCAYAPSPRLPLIQTLKRHAARRRAAPAQPQGVSDTAYQQRSNERQVDVPPQLVSMVMLWW